MARDARMWHQRAWYCHIALWYCLLCCRHNVNNNMTVMMCSCVPSMYDIHLVMYNIFAGAYIWHGISVAIARKQQRSSIISIIGVTRWQKRVAWLSGAMALYNIDLCKRSSMRLPYLISMAKIITGRSA